MSKPFLLVIAGQRGNGKTSILKGYDGTGPGKPKPGIIDALEGPVLLVDPIGTFRDVAEGINTAGQLARLLLAIDSGRAEYGSNIFRLTPQTDSAADDIFHAVRHSKLTCTLVIDEASMYHGNEDLDAIARYNRNPELGGQSLIVVARRLKELPINIRSQADAVVTFRQTDPADLTELKRLGIDETQVQALSVGEAMTAGQPQSLPLPVQNVIGVWTADAKT